MDKPHHGRKLKTILELHNKDAISTITRVLKLSKQGAYNLLERERFRHAEKFTLCVSLNIPPAEFMSQEEAAVFTTSDFRDFFEDQFKPTEFFSLDQFLEDQPDQDLSEIRREFVEEYFKGILSFIEPAKDNITIATYLPEKRFPYHEYESKKSQYFIETRERYYQGIQNLLSQKTSLELIRIFQLPVSHDGKELPLSEIVERLIELSYHEIFAHLLDCFDNCPNQFKLYVAANYVRPFTFFIVDQKQILTEYDRYNRRGVAFPNMRFCEYTTRSGDTTFKVIASHQNDIQRVIEKNADRFGGNGISRQQLINACKDLYLKKQLEILEIKQRIEAIENQLTTGALMTSGEDLSSLRQEVIDLRKKSDRLDQVKKTLKRNLDYVNKKLPKKKTSPSVSSSVSSH